MLIAAVKGLVTDDDASSTVRVTQSWRLGFAVGAGEDAGALAAKLEAVCQATSPDCALVSSRRRALQGNGDGGGGSGDNGGGSGDSGGGSSGGSSGSGGSGGGGGSGGAVLSRSLTEGDLAAAIPGLDSSGVAVSTASLQFIDVLLAVTKQGGATEADALLLDSSLAEARVRATISADLGLAEEALTVDVQRPIFPPMPPPTAPPPSSSQPSAPPPLAGGKGGGWEEEEENTILSMLEAFIATPGGLAAAIGGAALLWVLCTLCIVCRHRRQTKRNASRQRSLSGQLGTPPSPSSRPGALSQRAPSGCTSRLDRSAAPCPKVAPRDGMAPHAACRPLSIYVYMPPRPPGAHGCRGRVLSA